MTSPVPHTDQYGEPDGHRPSGVAPPCRRCGRREQSHSDLCAECAEEVSEPVEDDRADEPDEDGGSR